MRVSAFGVAVVLLAGCASGPRCPFGTAALPARAARIEALLASTSGRAAPGAAPLPICFDTSGEHGQLLQRDGVRAVLSEARDDRELAAELAHLWVHVADGIGDGCARGLDAALASEARAEERENRVRGELGLPRAAPSEAARDDYRRRCR